MINDNCITCFDVNDFVTEDKEKLKELLYELIKQSYKAGYEHGKAEQESYNKGFIEGMNSNKPIIGYDKNSNPIYEEIKIGDPCDIPRYDRTGRPPYKFPDITC